MRTATVFLSCRDEDAALAAPVRRALDAAQMTVVQYRDAIPDAELFVACVSADGYVSDELDLAIDVLQRLERDRWWLLVVPVDKCEIPALTITSKVDLRDLVVPLGELAHRLASRRGAGTLVTETEVQRLMGSSGVLVGTEVSDEPTGDVHTKTTYGEVTMDGRVVVIGTSLGANGRRKS
jgi:hypothetical protein